jgi:hypothetical protein
MGVQGAITAEAPRRTEALAYIIERIVRSGTSPSSGDIGRALGVSRTRAQQLVDQLIVEKVLGRAPGSRSLQVIDMTYSRHIIVEKLRALGVTVAEPMGDLQPPLSFEQLPILPPFEHLPDPD